jgi:hypothetical protein
MLEKKLEGMLLLTVILWFILKLSKFVNLNVVNNLKTEDSSDRTAKSSLQGKKSG